MKTIPKKDRRAKTGSNLRGKPLLAHRSKLLAEQQRPLERLARDFQREAKKLFSKADLRTAAELAKAVKSEWRQASLTVGGDSAKVDAIKASARRKLDRLLGRTLPNYRKLKALQREHGREHRKLVKGLLAAPTRGQVNVSWGNVLPPDLPDPREFKAPFPIFDVHSIGEGGIIMEDESYVLPKTGQLLNKIIFNHNEDTPFILGIWDFTRFMNASNLVSCGIPFTMPRSGRLQIWAALQYFYSKVTLSLLDSFGFSRGAVLVRLRVFIDIVRYSEVIHLPKELLFSDLYSDGDDVDHTIAELDNSVPYQVQGSTEESLPAGEVLYIVAGCEVQFASYLDDMHSYLAALLWWHLKKLTVAVVD